MNTVSALPSCQFTVISPAGFKILSALDWAAQTLQQNIVITSACDGAHSGPDDPHHKGEAYDIRSHDLQDDSSKQQRLQVIMEELTETSPTEGDGGLLTEQFFGWIENKGTPDEHIHVQLRHSVQYP